MQRHSPSIYVSHSHHQRSDLFLQTLGPAVLTHVLSVDARGSLMLPHLYLGHGLSTIWASLAMPNPGG